MGYQGYQGYGPKADIASLLIQQQAAQANGMKGAPGAGAPFPPSQYPQSAGGPDLGAIPDIGSAEQQAGSSRKIADLLMDRAMSRNQQGDVVNWGTGLGQLGEALLARNANKKADAAEASLATAEGDKRQQIAQLLASASNASPQQQALLLAGVGGEAVAERVLSGPAKPLEINGQLVDPTTYEPIADFRTAEKPADNWVKYDPPPGAPPGLYKQNTVTGDIQRVAGPTSTGTTVNVGGNGAGYRTLSEVPDRMPIPEGLLPADMLEKGEVAIRDVNDPMGFTVRTATGSKSYNETQGAAATAEKKAGNVNFTVGTLIGNYATLRDNKAITARGNTAMENAAAIYSGTGIGKAQDALGGEVGNLDNSEARQNIDGISMNALMQMISASDVSAKAMDSDAEMKAWLGAIKSDNYEAALTKLHVLDVSFGSGTALLEAYQRGEVDLETYQYITKQLETDPTVQKMLAKAQQAAAMGGGGSSQDDGLPPGWQVVE